MAERAVSGGKQVARVLKEEGVEYIFGLQGGHIWPVLMGCGTAGIKMVHFRHEQGGGYAADASSRPGRSDQRDQRIPPAIQPGSYQHVDVGSRVWTVPGSGADVGASARVRSGRADL